MNFPRKSILGIIIFLGLWIGFFSLYSLGISNTAVMVADSDDLALAAWGNGLAHPPGYPFQLLIYQFWLTLINEDPAEALHLLSAVVASFNVGLLFLVIVELNRCLLQKEAAKVAALLAAIAFGFSKRQLFHGSVTEVFVWAEMGTLLFIYLGLTQKNSLLRAFSLGILFVVGFMLHQLTLPVLIVLSLLFVRKRTWWWYIAGIFIGLILSVWTYFRIDVAASTYSWLVPTNGIELLRIVLRQVYAVGGSAIETYTQTYSIAALLNSLSLFITVVIAQHSWILLATGMIGGAHIYRTSRRVFILWLFLLVLMGPGLSLYLKFPDYAVASDTEYFWGTFLRWRMYFVFELLVTILGGIGLLFVVDKLTRKPRLFAASVLLLVIFFTFYLGRKQVILTYGEQRTFVSIYTTTLFNTLPINSVVIVDSDVVFALLYRQLIYEQRKDVLIVPARFQLYFNKAPSISYWNNQLLQDLELGIFMQRQLEKHRRVFLYHPELRLMSVLGGEGNPFYFANHGYFIEASLSPLEWVQNQDYGISQTLQAYTPQAYGYWDLGLQGHLGQLHALLAMNAARYGYQDAADTHLSLASALTKTPSSTKLIVTLFEASEHAFLTSGSPIFYTPATAEEILSGSRNPVIQAAQAYLIDSTSEVSLSRLDQYFLESDAGEFDIFLKDANRE